MAKSKRYEVITGYAAPGFFKGDVVAAEDFGDLLDSHIGIGAVRETDDPLTTTPTTVGLVAPNAKLGDDTDNDDLTGFTAKELRTYAESIGANVATGVDKQGVVDAIIAKRRQQTADANLTPSDPPATEEPPQV